jgi:hypothetical protein
MHSIGRIPGKIFKRRGCHIFMNQEAESRIRAGRGWEDVSGRGAPLMITHPRALIATVPKARILPLKEE